MVTIIVLIALAVVLYFLDITREIENLSDELKQMAIDKDIKNGFPFAYSMNLNENEVKLTLYSNEEVVKDVITFNIVDGVAKSHEYERHFKTKSQANHYSKDYTWINNIKVENNIVKGSLQGNNSLIGMSVEELVSQLRNSWNLSNIVEVP